MVYSTVIVNRRILLYILPVSSKELPSNRCSWGVQGIQNRHLSICHVCSKEEPVLRMDKRKQYPSLGREHILQYKENIKFS